jgi:riboflavin kinase/FMN adenylyltransferase
MNIGHRPTVEQTSQLHLEAHLFDFNEDIYDQNIRVELVSRIREEKKFGSIDELKHQIFVDVASAKSILS